MASAYIFFLSSIDIRYLVYKNISKYMYMYVFLKLKNVVGTGIFY